MEKTVGIRLLGLDLGSVRVKAALLDGDAPPVVASAPLRGRVGEAVAACLAQLRALAADGPVRVGVTGNGRDLVHGPAHRENEVVALARAVRRLSPGARSAIEIGGHASRWALLEEDGGLADYGLNQQCAAGSGAFMEQQAGRLGLSIERFAQMAAEAPRGATVAGRCSVFAKSDMIHLGQKGTPTGEIAYGLCLAVARNFVATVLRGRESPAPVALAGGTAANPALVRAIAEVLGLAPGQLLASPHPGAEGAIGAALAAGDAGAQALALSEVEAALQVREATGGEVRHEPLRLRGDEAAPLDPAPETGPIEAFLGVDVGSVSTNLVLLGRDGEVYEGLYLPTRSRPVEVVGAGLDSIAARFGGRLRVLGVAVTGSGRHLAAQLLGADLVKNEITCQARAAAAAFPEVDTLFEIGGQDSKYVSLRDGCVRDFVMNKICAAGTGSFLEEQAGHLGVPIVGKYSELAGQARAPAELGCQCTVFMHSEVVAAERRGTGTEDLCAGLALSVARNYLDRVVAGRPVGAHVVFQGGVAANRAVVAAFEAVLGRRVRVHPYARVSGALGAALLVREAAPEKTAFRGFGACRDHQVKSFECHVCENRCQVNRILLDGRRVFFGDACERYSSTTTHRPAAKAKDLTALWEPPARERRPAPRGKIGLPRASTLLYDPLFWDEFFASLGFEVVRSRPTSQLTLQAGLKRLPAETCLPIKLAFGHVQELADAGAERIFLPSILTRAGDEKERAHSCPYVEAVPYMVKAALSASCLSPEVDFHGEVEFVRGLAPALAPLGVEEREVAEALGRAAAAQRAFREKLLQAGRAALEGAGRAFVVIGKPYNVLDPYLNLNLFQHLARLGVVALPMWCLPFEDEPLDPRFDRLPWHYNRDMLRAAQLCRREPRLHPVIVSNFGCGPDAFTHKHLATMLEGVHHLALEFDEHRGEAGLVTRLEAFLDELDADRAPRRPRVEAAPAPGAALEAAREQKRRSFVVPWFTDHAYVFAGALQAAGHGARVLPPPGEAVLRLGEENTSGKECSPFQQLNGDLVQLARSARTREETFFYPGTAIPCLMHQYGDGHRHTLERLGARGLDVLTPNFLQMRELFGLDVGVRLWRGLVAMDLLVKMACETRPYELEPGATDAAHERNVHDIETAVATDELQAALSMAVARLRMVPVDRSQPRPLVGVAGDIFTRANPVANQDLFHWLEARGCEVWPAPFLTDITDYALRRTWSRGGFGDAALKGALIVRKNMESWRVHRAFSGAVRRAEEPDYDEVVAHAAPYLGRETNEVLVLNVAKMVDFARRGADGIINALCFNCMLGTVSAAITGRIREAHGGIPIANLVYSPVEGSQRATLEAFVHQVRAFSRRRAANAQVEEEKPGLWARLRAGT